MFKVTIATKIITKDYIFKKYIGEAINFVIITKHSSFG